MPARIYRFASCEVDTRARELRVNGKSKSIEPLPFDALVLLLQHRDRNLSTKELLDRLWPDDPVSPGAVVTAIAKVRRAIEDDGSPPLIRTVHRVGYRFIADVVEELPRDAQPGVSNSDFPAVPIALLPFENLTGTPSLDWVSLGLMALVCHVLSQDEQLSPLPVSTVVGTLRAAGVLEIGAHSERAAALRRITGVGRIVHTRLQRHDGAYQLDCRLSLPKGEVTTVLRAAHPVKLGRVLADWLLAQLGAGRTIKPASGAQMDPWALEVLARALDASARRQWERADALLAVVLDIEPDHVVGLLERSHVRARRCEAEGDFDVALEMWRETAERARANGQQPVAERANGRAALAAAMCGRTDEALSRAEAALVHAQVQGTELDTWDAARLWWQVLTMLGRPSSGDSFLPAHCDETANTEVRAAWWAAHAQRLGRADDHSGAARAFAAAAAMYREMHAVERERNLLLPWLEALQRAGQFDEAETVLRRIEAGNGGNGMVLRWLPWFQACQLDARCDRPGAMLALTKLLEGKARDLPHAAAVAMSARWLAEDGRADAARATLATSGARFESHPVIRAAAAHIDRLAG